MIDFLQSLAAEFYHGLSWSLQKTWSCSLSRSCHDLLILSDVLVLILDPCETDHDVLGTRDDRNQKDTFDL